MHDISKPEQASTIKRSEEVVLPLYALHFLSMAAGMLVGPPLPDRQQVENLGLNPENIERLIAEYLDEHPPTELAKLVQRCIVPLDDLRSLRPADGASTDQDDTRSVFEALRKAVPDEVREAAFAALLDETARLVEAVLVELNVAASSALKTSSYRPQQLIGPSDLISCLVRTAFAGRDLWRSILGGYQTSATTDAGSASLTMKREGMVPDDLYDDEGNVIPEVAEEWAAPLKACVDRMGDLHSDVFDVLVCRWLEGYGGNLEHWSQVSVPDIISARSVKARRGKPGAEAIEQYGKTLEDVLLLKVEGQAKFYLRGKRGKSEQQSMDTPLFAVADKIFSYKAFGRPLLVGIRYRPGQWIRYLVGGDYTPQLAHILQCALTFDPYHQWKEKRLARYLSYLFRTNRGAARDITMKALLAGAHIETTKTADTEPAEYIRGVESAIRNVVSSWGQGGEIVCLDTAPLPRKGKLDAWLARKWRVVPPDAVCSHYAAADSGRKKHNTPTKKPDPRGAQGVAETERPAQNRL